MENFTQRRLLWLRGEINVYRGGIILAKGTSCAKKQEQGNGKFKGLKGSYYDRRLSVKGQVTRCETGELPLLRHLELIQKLRELLKHFRQGSDISTSASVDGSFTYRVRNNLGRRYVVGTLNWKRTAALRWKESGRI